MPLLVRAAGLATLLLSMTSASAAAIIRDADFFSTIPHAFIDFEARGDGSPVGLGFLDIEIFGKNEYEPMGFVFDDRPTAWIHVGTPSAGTLDEGNAADAIQAIGSLWTALGGSGAQGWAIHFTAPVHAFGFAAVRDGFLRDDPTLIPRVEAYAADNSLLGVLELSGDMVQGNFGGLWAGGMFGEIYQVEYGFMGLASSTPIARLEFINGGGYDNFHFSAVPAPGAGAALLLAGALTLRRRR